MCRAENRTVVFPLSPLSILYPPECYTVNSRFLLCLLKLKPLLYSENQIIQKAETAAVSTVVVETAKPIQLETILGAQEEIVTQQDQMHITHEKVTVLAGVKFTLVSFHLQATYIFILGLKMITFSPSSLLITHTGSFTISQEPFSICPAFTTTFHS